MRFPVLQLILGGVLLNITPGSAPAAESGIQRFGLYVVVADMNRSEAFYTQLFQKPPYVKTAQLIGFNVAGGLYAVFAARGLDRPLTRGDNSVPYLRVKNVQAEFMRVKELPARLLDAEIVREGPVSLFRFADPDGNVLEFFSVREPTQK